MIPNFPIPDSGIPNSEFRMAYGKSGIPHHEIGAAGAHGRAHGPGVTGWDTGCRTLEFYVNSGVGHGMSWGGTWLPSDKSEVTK